MSSEKFKKKIRQSVKAFRVRSGIIYSGDAQSSKVFELVAAE